jgi:Competence-damaged protein
LLLDIPDSAFTGIRGVTEPLAEVLARGTLKRFSTTWSLAEVGAAGPTGNRYGDPAGHSCSAIAGPIERAITVETGSADRVANMRSFAAAALELLFKGLTSSPRRVPERARNIWIAELLNRASRRGAPGLTRPGRITPARESGSESACA